MDTKYPEEGDRPYVKNLPPRLRALQQQKKPQGKPEVPEAAQPPKFILARRAPGEAADVIGIQREDEETCFQAEAKPDEELLLDVADPMFNIQEFIVSRLELTKDRLFMLQLEKDFLEFLSDSKRDYMAFPSLSSYHRMLVHRVAAYFGLEHLMDSTSQTILVSKGPNTRMPKMRFSEMATVESSREETASPKMILRRKSSDQSLKEPSPPALATSTTSEEKKKSKKLKTIEEREAEYNEARARIFNQAPSSDSSRRSSLETDDPATTTRKQPEIDDADEYRRSPVPVSMATKDDPEYSRRLVNFKSATSLPVPPPPQRTTSPPQFYAQTPRIQSSYSFLPQGYMNRGPFSQPAPQQQQQRYGYPSYPGPYQGVSREPSAPWLLQQQRQYEHLLHLQQQQQQYQLRLSRLPGPFKSPPPPVFDIYDVSAGVSIETDVIPLVRQLGGDVRAVGSGLVAVFGDGAKARYAFEYCQKQPHGKFKLRTSSPDVLEAFSRMNIS